MTITNTILRNDYTGNGVATVFNFTFIVLNETGGYTIQVITTDLSGIETIRTQNVDYTVQLNDNGLGTITFTTAPLLNHKITLLSNVPNTQETDYIKAGTDKFPAESHEKALDKLTLICKQFTERFNRIVSLPKNSNLSNIEFPINPNNSNQVITINNDGTNLTTRDLADVGLAPVSSYIKTLLDDINSSQARATLEAQQLNNNLTALASLIGSSNKIPYFTGSGAMALTDIVSPASATTQGTQYLDKPITISNNIADPNNDIDFSAGNFIFSDKTGQAIATAMTKKLQSSGSWSAGNNGNMLLSGARANSSTYHLFALYKTDGTVDYGAMLGIAGTAPNPTSVLPSGYTKWQLIESIITDSSGNIISFTQIGNRIELVSSIQTHTTVSQAVATETLRTLSAAIPVGRQVMAFGTAFTQYITAANNPYLKVYSAQMVKPTLNASEGQMSTNANSTGPIYGNGFWQAITNTSAQIKTNGSSGSQNININVDGWVSLI